MANDITIRVTAKDEASRTFEAVDKKAQGLGSTFASVAAKAALAFGALGATAGIAKAIGAASSLSESISKVNVVFGDSAKEIQDWASESATAFGQSKQQALEAAGTYGNLFQAFGVGRQEASKMSKSLVELAADLASFNNTSVDEALIALRSGLSGETEPLKRFGVAINDVRLRDEALRLGLIKTTKDALSPGAKAQAAYALIMKDTTLAQGDFARTSSGMANSVRIIKAQFADISAQVGMVFLPVVEKLLGFLSKNLPTALNTAGRAFDEAKAFAGGFVTDVLDRLVALGGQGISGINSLIETVKDLSHLYQLGFDGGRIGGEFSLIERAAFTLGRVFKENIIPAFNDVREAVRLFLFVLQGGTVGGEFSRLQTSFIEFGTEVRRVWLEDVKPALQELGTFAIQVVNLIAENWPTIRVVLKTVFEEVGTRIVGFIESVLGIVEILSNVVQLISAIAKGDWKTAWDEVKQIAQGVVEQIMTMLQTQFGGLPAKMLDWGLEAGKSLANGIISALNSLMDLVSGIEIIPGNTQGPIHWNPVTLPDPGFRIPKLATGTPYVPQDMLAYLHKGEAVIPAAENKDRMRAGGGDIIVNTYAPINIHPAGGGADVSRDVGSVGYAIAVEARSRGISPASTPSYSFAGTSGSSGSVFG